MTDSVNLNPGQGKPSPTAERSKGWRQGFERCETDFFYGLILENPYPSGSDEDAGYEAAAYILEQK